MIPKVGLTDSQRKSVAEILKKILGSEAVLDFKTRNYHWNIQGSNFSEYHALFQGHYEKLDDALDDLAERIRQLGEAAPGSMKEFLNLSLLQESTGIPGNGLKMVKSLVEDHELLIREIRRSIDECSEKFHDTGNADMLTGLMEEHEKMAWMLRSYLA